MALKIAINGFGRIGRAANRIIEQNDDMRLVWANDIYSPDMMSYLFKFDSVYGRHTNSSGTKFFCNENIEDMPDRAFEVDVVLECSGRDLSQEYLKKYIKKGAKKVILSAYSPNLPTYIIGVNDKEYKNEPVISASSCTANCLSPVAEILDNEYGIDKACITTIHSYTSGQNLLDVKNSDIRKSRSATQNIIPVDTNIAKSTEQLLPNLKNKLSGSSLRIPLENSVLIDFNAVLNKKVSAQELNDLFLEKSKNEFKNIIQYSDGSLVSSDITKNTHSSIVDAALTQVIGGDMIKLMLWQDNEMGYASRLVDMARLVSSRI